LRAASLAAEVTMSGPHVLVATQDAQLRTAVQRLADVAGVATQHLSGGEIRGRWQSVAAVVLDPVTARYCAQADLPRRTRVLIVTPGEAEAEAGSWPLAVAVGAEAVHVLPREERQVADWLAVAVEPDEIGRTVICLPARGGAGASTLAASLALAAGARGEQVLLVDGDPWAGGIDVLLGIEELDGARWDSLTDTAGVLAASALAQALPAVGRLRVLSGARSRPEPLTSAAVEAALAAGRRGHTLVVADLPGPSGQLPEAVRAHARTALVVVPAEVRAVAAASVAVAELSAAGADVGLVVRQPGPAGLRPRDVREAVGAPVAAVWPWERRLARVVERGRFAREWRRTRVGELAEGLLDPLMASAA
jgi:secretion/DNA translocation related CpaE-like protein